MTVSGTYYFYLTLLFSFVLDAEMCSLVVDRLGCLLEEAFLRRRLIILVFFLCHLPFALLCFRLFIIFLSVLCAHEKICSRENLVLAITIGGFFFILFLLFAYIFSMFLWDIFFVYCSISNVKASVVELT